MEETTMDLKARIEEYWNAPEQRKLLCDLTGKLVAVRSVREEPQENAPFGPGPAKCLDLALELCESLGFTTENVDHYVGTADLNDKPTILHILGHLDVVGEGKGWTREPYQMVEEDGLLYGRGVADDKGPVVTALLAMKCVRDLGLDLPYNAKLILGTDEETGSSDIAYYYKKAPFAKYTFSPDASFPLIHIEKGSYKPVFSKTFAPTEATPRVVSLNGGFRINVVPGDAEALVVGLTAPAVGAALAKVAEETGVTFTAKAEGDGCRIVAKGVGGHASLPELSRNALTALLKLLATLPLAECDSTTAIRDLAALFPFGDNGGKALGMALEDELSGATSVAFTLLSMDENGFEGQFDSRTAISANEENTRLPVEAAFGKLGIRCVGTLGAAHHTPADSPIATKLLHCYEAYSGETGTKPMAIGGGTYVHDIPGGVAFGCEVEGFDCSMHGPDEKVQIDTLLFSGKVFTQAIIDLCSE